MINTYSTLVATAMENTIVFFSIVFDLHHFTMIMAAQLGCMKLIYTNYITPLLQLVFQFLDWPSAISSYNAITRITPVSKTDSNLLVIHLCLFCCNPLKNFLKSLLLINVGLETPFPKWIFEM
jgi:hypothetical protein